MSEQLALLPGLLVAHLQLTLFALAVGVACSVPLGVAIHRMPRLEQPVLGTASVIQTIPGLALLALMVAALASLGVQSIGFLPAFIGLALYSLLPILRNTVTGLAQLDPALVEAARGVGMTPSQRLWRIELPLALPVIIAGLRVSTVWTVGMATLSTPVGAPSLGNYIFSGLQTRNLTAVLVGCVASALLALLLDGLVRALSMSIEQRRRTLRWGTLAAVGVLYLISGAAASRAWLAADEALVRIGAKVYTEQYVLGEILAGQVRRVAGLPAQTIAGLGSTVAFDALESGQIDAYVDYTGTIWATIMHRESTPETRDSVLDEVGRYLEGRGVLVVGALGYENAYALAIRRAEAERLGLRRISDVVPVADGLSLGGDLEFFGRREWRDLADIYGLAFREQRSMDPSLMYQAAASGEVDLITAYSTDGRIDAFDLAVLEDDRGAFPPYDAVILARATLVRERPAAVEALRGLVGRIDEVTMRRLNGRVDQGGETPAAVASSFLDEFHADREP